MTIAITSSGIALDGPLVAGEKVAVSVSGLALAAEDKPTLALLARFPDALLASVELAEDAQTPGTWTGKLDTATKQTALFFATARADERRDAALELVAGRVSLARLTVPMANSALCPKPDGSPFASPVYVPVPGPPGQGGDPYDQAPLMDGEASAGTADEYARGDHRHPTDATRLAVIEDLAAIRSGAAAGATAVQPAALSAYRTAAAQDAIDGTQDTAIAAKYTKPATGIPAGDLASDVQTALTNARTPTAHAATHAATGSDPLDGSMMNVGGSSGAAASSIANAIEDLFQFKAELDSPSFTGTPTAPTPQAGENSTLVSTTEFVQGAVGDRAKSASLAAAFSTSSTYAVGDYVTREGLLYKCTTAVSTAGAWNASDWEAVVVTDEMGGGAAYYEIQYLQSTGTQYIDTGVTAGLGVRVVAEVEWDSLAMNDQAFGSAKKYSGSYSNRWFVGVAADSTGYVSAGADASYISPKTSAVAVTTGTRYTYDYTITASSATLLISGNSAISQSGTFSFAEPFPIFAFARNASGTAENFSSIKLYSLKIYSGDTLVRDFVPVRSGFDGALLDRVSGAIFGNAGSGVFVLGQDVNPPVPTESPAFTGTPTAPTAAAGTNTTQVATTAFVQTAVSGKADAAALRYSLPAAIAATDATSTAALQDRAVNTVTVGSAVTTLNLTFPAAVAGYARDFFLRLECAGTALATIALPSGETVDFGADALAGLTGKAGVHLAMFTEIAANHWLISAKESES